MIAIKGMEKPESCWDCPILCKENGQCKKTEKYIYGNDIPADCPLTEIVTCKDCRYCCHITNTPKVLLCEKHNCQQVSKNFYCADGKRK